jgi:hypothetical protein
MTNIIFFVLYGASLYFFGAIVGSGRVKQRLVAKVGVRVLDLTKIKTTTFDDYRMGCIAGMKWAVDQVMDEPVDWEKLKEIYDEQ